MPNWVNNRLTITGSKNDLKVLSNAIGNNNVPIDFQKLATVVSLMWDARDERPETR